MFPIWPSSPRYSPRAAIVGFAGSIAHKADVGGAVPGSTSADATEMFQEGLLLPPIKIVAAGTMPDRHRAHHPEQQPPACADARRHSRADRGDADGRRTRQGVVRAVRRGAPSSQAFAAILKGAADELRNAIARLPRGRSVGQGLLDNDGIEVDRPIRLAVTVAIKDGIVSFDFSNSDPQARGASQSAAVAGRGLRVLFPDRMLRTRSALQ